MLVFTFVVYFVILRTCHAINFLLLTSTDWYLEDSTSDLAVPIWHVRAERIRERQRDSGLSVSAAELGFESGRDTKSTQNT